MPYCSECKKWVADDEGTTYLEDTSFSYSGTHCTNGQDGIHHQTGSELSCCCDAEVIDYLEDEDDR